MHASCFLFFSWWSMSWDEAGFFVLKKPSHRPMWFGTHIGRRCCCCSKVMQCFEAPKMALNWHISLNIALHYPCQCSSGINSYLQIISFLVALGSAVLAAAIWAVSMCLIARLCFSELVCMSLQQKKMLQSYSNLKDASWGGQWTKLLFSPLLLSGNHSFTDTCVSLLC